MKFKIDTTTMTIWLQDSEDYTDLFAWVNENLNGEDWKIKTEGVTKSPYDVFDRNSPIPLGPMVAPLPDTHTWPLTTPMTTPVDPYTVNTPYYTTGTGRSITLAGKV